MNSLSTSSTRTRKSANNFVSGIFSQLVILILNFVIRYLFIKSIGYEYLGINSLFTGILTILSVADLGFGSALGIVLYSSLAKKEEKEIAGLMNFFKKVYLTIGLVVTVAGLAVAPFVKYLVNTEADIPNLTIYFLLFLLNTVSSYFVSYRAILIRADQKNSVVNNATTIVKIAKAVLEALVLLIVPKLLGLTWAYILYLVVMVLSTYAIGIITAIYAKKKYSYAFGNKIQVSKEKKSEIISTTKDLLIYRICNALATPIDSVVISLFVGTFVLGIYSNYLLIFTTLMEFICLLSRNVISSVGNFVVEKPIEEQKKLYFEMQLIYFAVIIFCTINFVSLVSPFISTIFGSETTLSIWVVFLLGGTLIMRCMGELAIIFRETTKVFKKTKYIALFNTVLHLGLSVLFGFIMGLEGILLGNFLAYFLTNLWFEIFGLFKWHFKCSAAKVYFQFAFILLITCGMSVAGYFIVSSIASGGIIRLGLGAIASLTISILSLSCLYFFDGFKQFFERIRIFAVRFKNIAVKWYTSKKAQISVIGSYIFAVFVLLILRDLLGININKFVFFGLLIVATLLCNRSNAIWLILFTLPFGASLAELYILTYSFAYLFLATFKNRNLKKWFLVFSVPIAIFSLEIILSLIYGTVNLALSLRILVLLSILSICFYDRHIFTKKHLFAIIFGCLFLLIVISIDWIVPAIYGVTHKSKEGSWLDFSALFKNVRLGFSSMDWIKDHAKITYPYTPIAFVTENPNNIGLISIICLSLLATIQGTFRGRKKIFSWFLMLLFTLFGIWSQSRTFLLVFALLVVTFIFIPLISKRCTLNESLIKLSIVGIVVALVLVISPDAIKNIIDRFSDRTASTGGGRTELAVDYLKFLFSDWKYALFGLSCNNLERMSQIGIVPHMNVIQFVGSYGLLFFIVFIVFIVFSVRKTKKMKFRSADFYLIMPLIFTFVFTLTLQLFAPVIILVMFIPSMICLSFLNNDINDEKRLIYFRSRPPVLEKGQPINVAMMSTSFGGGIASYIYNITPFLCDDHNKVSFIFNPDTTSKEIERFKTINCEKYEYSKKKSKFKIFHLVKKYRYYRRCFDECNPDIIYINTSSYLRSLIIFIAAVFYRGSHIIVHSHMAVNNQTKLSFAEKFTRFFADFIKIEQFACSLECGRVFFGKHFLKKNKDYQAVISNFINCDSFKFNKRERTIKRNELGIKNDEILIGSVGRLHADKNHVFLVELLVKLPEKYKLIIFGDGPEKDNILLEIEKMKLQDRATVHKSTTEICRYYNAFDIFALPSFIEGLPFVSVEAQCNGLHNILADGLPKSTKITDNVCFLPLDKNIWAKHILKLTPTSMEERKRRFELVVKNGFSSKDAPIKIVERIKRVVYEQ